MTPDPSRAPEVDRLAALRRTGLLDTPPEEAFDRLTRLASRILEAPVALVSLVDRDRQFFKSAVGFPEGWTHVRETPLSHSLCQHVVATGVPLAVEDAREHPVLAASPAIASMGMVSYAGVPLSASDGHVLGAFCVLDATPREWTDREVEVLRDLAASVVTEIELRRDASIRAAVQEELRRERDFVLQLVNTMGQGLTVTDVEGRFRFVNPQFGRLLGREVDDLLGMGGDDVVAPADREALRDARAQWRAGETLSYELGLLRADGSTVPALMTSSPRVEDGTVVGSITVVSNLTQRKRNEEELRRSERQFRLMIENATDLITLLDDAGTIRYGSPAVRRVLAYPPEALVGRSVFDLVHPADVSRVKEAFARIVDTPGVPLSVELRFLHGGGGYLQLEATGASFLDDPAVGSVVVNSRDVSDRRRAEAALRKSEEQFRQFVEAASDIIYRADMEGRFTYANPVAARILGHSQDELLGTRYVELVRPDWRERVGEFYRRQVEERVANTYYEFPAVTRDGREVWIGQNVQLVTEGDRLAGWQAVARDITGRREIDRMKDEFISMVSHELRTPLASMRGSLGLVAGGLTGTLDARGKRLVEIALQNTDRLARLVDDILDTERIAAGKLPISPQPTDAAELMERAAEPLREMAERAGVALEVDPLPAALLADPDRVIQTLTNLLANAIKFSPEGSVVRLDARGRGPRVLFRVADQGPGIPHDRREVIFEPFRQLDSSDSRRKGGTGLGLAICRSIVREHGGEIWVEDAPGGGSVFCFTLPAAEGGPAPPA
ncbi:MAG TPA: PAS domain S-box protein [Longimicrobiaceae bacterium]|jgi:PAS domain S-box-containing protein